MRNSSPCLASLIAAMLGGAALVASEAPQAAPTKIEPVGSASVIYLGESVTPGLRDIGINYQANLRFDSPGKVVVDDNDVLANDAGIEAAGQIIGKTRSRAWFDGNNVGGVQYDGNGDGKTNGFGWTHHSRWVMIDVDPLRNMGYRKAIITVAVSPRNDRTAANDLVGGLTLWRGIDQRSPTTHWFPNTFQENEGAWWAEDIRDRGLGAVTGTALSRDASLSRTITLDAVNADLNKLTLAIGGNDQKTAKHEVNFILTVTVRGAN